MLASWPTNVMVGSRFVGKARENEEKLYRLRMNVDSSEGLRERSRVKVQ
jgi:hypothetical protein